LRRALALLGLVVLQAGMALPAAHAQREAQEHEVKAAFLYRFLPFIEWPAQAFRDSKAPVTIGVLGADDIAASLEQVLPGRTAQGRTVLVRRVRPGEPLAGVHLLMVGRAEQERLPALARATAGHGVVLVGDGEDALDRGAAIGFLIDDGRVRFQVSLPAAERSGVRISARMLAVAHHVRAAAP
jgi:hypothetical protein